MSKRFFEDFSLGYRVKSDAYKVESDEIIRFAQQWDPQPFHLDVDAARDSVFGTLVASGIHTFAITVRLGFDCGVFSGNAIAGLSMDKIHFVAPVMPGEVLTARFTVSYLRKSTSRPGLGIVSWRTMTMNDREETVFTAIITNLTRCRDS